jgi:hypothetical protein
MKRKKTKSISKLKKEAWAIFSGWIRNRDNYTCYTCGTKYLPDEGYKMHAGHFVPRIHNATFLDEMNVHAQCYVCNIIKKGNAGEYAYRLIKEYGKEAFENLVKRGRTKKSFQPKELEELKQKYALTPPNN